MKRAVFSLFLTLNLVLHTSHAQQITLSGQVSIHNSRYRTGQIEYVKGAYATAPFTTPGETDDNGMFYLAFVGMDRGASVGLTLEKAGLEVVNTRDLLDVVIGREAPLKVFLAPQGQLTKAQDELYDINLKVLTARHEALVTALRQEGSARKAAMEELRKSLDREFKNWFEAEEYLNKQLESVKERLPETIKQLAAVNLDFASALYIEAYQLYEKGEIAQAIALLDAARLDEDAAQASTQLASITGDLENYRTARELAQERVGQIVRSYQLKAQSYSILFRYREAAEVYEKAIALLEKTKNEVDMELADAYLAIGKIYYDLEDFQRAFSYTQKSVEIFEALLNEKSPMLAIAYNNLALDYKAIGEYEKAVQFLKSALKIDEENFGPNHPFTANRLSNLATVYQEMGNLDIALQLLERALSIDIKNFEPDHPNLVRSKSNLALVYRELGEYTLAVPLLEDALVSNEKNFGPEHPMVATSQLNLASVYRDLGRFEEVAILLEKALISEEKNFGAYHPKLPTIQRDLAMVYLQLRRPELAAPILNKALEIDEKNFPADHVNIALNKFFLASVYLELERYEEAAQLMEEALDIEKKNLGLDHPQTFIRQSNLAYTLYKAGRHKDAVQRFEALLAHQENYFGAFHPEVAETQANLAVIYQESGDVSRARELLLQALKVFKEHYGENAASTVRVGNRLKGLEHENARD